MIRRQFLKLATLTSAAGVASIGAIDALEKHHAHEVAEAKNTKTVTWRVKGFSCPTCSVGLETLLRQEKGIVAASASYSRASVTIQYHPDEVTEASLRSYISELGFTAEA